VRERERQRFREWETERDRERVRGEVVEEGNFRAWVSGS